MNGSQSGYTEQHGRVLRQIEQLYYALVEHDGFGDMQVEVRILKRGQKEVIVHCGKQYRFVVDAAKKSH